MNGKGSGGPTSKVLKKRILFEKTGKTVLPHDLLPPRLEDRMRPGQDSIMYHYDRSNAWSAHTGQREKQKVTYGSMSKDKMKQILTKQSKSGRIGGTRSQL